MRILHMYAEPSLTHGAATFEYEISKVLKKDNIFFDYLFSEEIEAETKKRYSEQGSKVYRIPIDKNHGLLIRELKVNIQYFKFFKKHKYDIVYADTENALKAVHMLMARLAGVKVRVVHSHNTGLQTTSKFARILARIMRNIFYVSATDYFACSDEAAEWLFPKKIVRDKRYTVLKNGIDVDRFKYSSEARREVRELLNISEDEIIVGNVGRFMEQKNHKFMIEVFREFMEIQPNATLVLVGEGRLEGEIRKLVAEENLQYKVVFAGTTPDVEKYLSAMDVFLMPSLFEGLGMVAIEAQSNGLPCLLSTGVNKMVEITPKANFMSLDDDAKKWACKLNDLIDSRSDGTSEADEIRKAGYSVNETAKKLKIFYLKKAKK